MHCAKWSWKKCLSSPALDVSLIPEDTWRPGIWSQSESIYWWSDWHFDFLWCNRKWNISHPCNVMGFPGNSADKESACKAGDSGSVPASGSSPGEGIGYPLQYSWVSLVAQTVKNPPAMRKTRALRSLGWENPLEEEMATHFSILAWKILWTEEPDRLQSRGSERVGHDWAYTHTHTHTLKIPHVSTKVEDPTCHN